MSKKSATSRQKQPANSRVNINLDQDSAAAANEQQQIPMNNQDNSATKTRPSEAAPATTTVATKRVRLSNSNGRVAQENSTLGANGNEKQRLMDVNVVDDVQGQCPPNNDNQQQQQPTLLVSNSTNKSLIQMGKSPTLIGGQTNKPTLNSNSNMDKPSNHQKQPAAVNICAACLKPIKERYLLMAMEKKWHEDCLKCACCDCRLGEVGSSLFTHSDKILCRRDFLRIFGQKGFCAACKQTIPPYELVMRANENAYHMDCFACQQCQYRFCVGDRFHLTEMHKIICILCFNEQHQRHQQQQQQLHSSSQLSSSSSSSMGSLQASSQQPVTSNNMDSSLSSSLSDQEQTTAAAAAAAATATTVESEFTTNDEILIPSDQTIEQQHQQAPPEMTHKPAKQPAAHQPQQQQQACAM